MIELKRENVHVIVETEEQAQSLIYAGYTRLTPKEEVEEKEEEQPGANIEDFNLTLESIDSMGVLEMKDIAKSLKIKGYTNMGKTSLSKSLKELVSSC